MDKARILPKISRGRRFCRIAAGYFLFPALVASLLTTSGCGLGYLFQAAKGQYRLVTGAVPVSEALKSDALSPVQRERLVLVGEAKAFGQEGLGLKPTENYTTVYLEPRELTVYTVSAAPKDRLVSVRWCFPIVGCMPYIGFFDLQDARRKTGKLKAEGFDVHLGEAAAYSTLGWFKDPVTLDMLKEPTVPLVETLLHEMTHLTLYVKNQPDFNEGIAMLVGLYGARDFFEQSRGPEDPLTVQAEEMIHDERVFSLFLDSILLRLENLYDLPLSAADKIELRELAFEKAKQDFREVKERFRTHHFDFFERLPLNNASVVALAVYHAHFTLFEDILRANEGSIPKTLSLFRELEKKNKPLIQAGREWLSNERLKSTAPRAVSVKPTS